MDNQNTRLIEIIEEGLKSSGWARFRVISNSMQPLIRINDWVHAEGISKSVHLHFGDIVLFRRNGNIIMHRVIENNGRKVLTKGDRCLTFDEPVLREHVLAKVFQLERGNRIIKFHSFPGKLLGLIMAAVSLTVAGCYSWYRKLFQKNMEIV